MTSLDPPEVKRVKRERSEAAVDKNQKRYSFILKGGKTCDVIVRFSNVDISVESGWTSTLADLCILIGCTEVKGAKRDLESSVRVTSRGGTQSYELRQRLHESTRLRLGHLLPAELRAAPICYVGVNTEEEEEAERREPSCTLDVELKAVQREHDLRRVCGTVVVGGRTLSCSREILGLYSSKPSLFAPDFSATVVRNAAAAATAGVLRELTLQLTDREKRLEFTTFASLTDFFVKYTSCNLSSLLTHLLARLPPFYLRLQTPEEMVRFAANCGEGADKIMRSYLFRFKSLECLNRIYEEHKAKIPHWMMNIMFEAMFAMGKRVHDRPHVSFFFREGEVRVQLLADMWPVAARQLTRWLQDRVARSAAAANPFLPPSSSSSFRECFPYMACADRADAEGCRIALKHFPTVVANEVSPFMLHGQPMMVEIVPCPIGHDLRFSRHCDKPIGFVVQGAHLISRLTHLDRVVVTDVVRVNIGTGASQTSK